MQRYVVSQKSVAVNGRSKLIQEGTCFSSKQTTKTKKATERLYYDRWYAEMKLDGRAARYSVKLCQRAGGVKYREATMKSNTSSKFETCLPHPFTPPPSRRSSAQAEAYFLPT